MNRQSQVPRPAHGSPLGILRSLAETGQGQTLGQDAQTTSATESIGPVVPTSERVPPADAANRL